MALRRAPRTPQAPSASEDVRTGYQAAVTMLSYEGQKRWASAGVFIPLAVTLVAASLIPAFIPRLPAEASSILGLALSVLGLIASIIWLFFFLRFERITHYWILSARELEQQMSSPVQSFERGRHFAAGETVEVAGDRVTYRALERFPERWGLAAVYIIFALVFLSLMVLNIYRLCQPFTLVMAA